MLTSSIKQVCVLLLAIFLSSVGFAQTYTPTNFTTTNKSLGIAQAVSTDARSWMFDSTATHQVMRDYNGTSEVFSYLNIPKWRSGHFPIFVHSGGILQSNGFWLGGITLVYWFKDSTDNASLVRWYTDSTGLPGAPFYSVANNLSEGNAGLIKGNLSLDNVDNTSDATKNAASVSLTNHTIDGNLNTLQNIGNASLSNSTIGLSITANPASDIGVTATPVALGASLVANIPNSTASSRGALIGTDWNHFNIKLDSFHISNDSVYGCVNGTCTLQGVISGVGTVGSGLYDSAGKVIWGEPVGQAGAPAQLTGNSEIPMNAFSMELLESTDPDSTRVIFNDSTDGNTNVKVPIETIQKKSFGYFTQWKPRNYGTSYVSGYKPGSGGLMRPGAWSTGYETAASLDVMPDNVWNYACYNLDPQGNRRDTTEVGFRMGFESNYLNTLRGFAELSTETHLSEFIPWNNDRIRLSLYQAKSDGYTYLPFNVDLMEWKSNITKHTYADLSESDSRFARFELRGDGVGDDPDGQIKIINTSNGFTSFINGYNTNLQIGHSGNGNSSLQPFIINHSGDVILLNNPSSNPADYRNVIIGQDGIHGAASGKAVLDVRGITKGVVFCRMTTAQFGAISSPDTGTMAQLVDSGYRVAYTNGTNIAAYLTSNEVSSGTFTSTLTNTTNITSSSFSSAIWTKNGNVITVRVSGSVTPTLGSTSTVLTFSLPITTATTTQASVGTGTVNVNAAAYVSGLSAVNSGTTATFTFIPGASVGASDFCIRIDYVL